MGTYLQLEAKPGCEAQVNEAYAAITGKTGDFLVYSAEVIQAEIAYIHSAEGSAQAHLRRSLRTVADWNRLFPSERAGTGSLKLSGLDDEDAAAVDQAKRVIAFILANRMLFARIDGLDDARQEGLCDFPGDRIENNQTLPRESTAEPTFADLPRGRSTFYQNCVAHNRPDLWAAYRAFQDNPCEATWLALRTKIVPWNGNLVGLWPAVERLATQRDGQDFGLYGRFRDGQVPPLTLVRAALR